MLMLVVLVVLVADTGWHALTVLGCVCLWGTGACPAVLGLRLCGGGATPVVDELRCEGTAGAWCSSGMRVRRA